MIKRLLKKLLAPIIREIVIEETNPYKGMTKADVDAWFQEMKKRTLSNHS